MSKGEKVDSGRHKHNEKMTSTHTHTHTHTHTKRKQNTKEPLTIKRLKMIQSRSKTKKLT